MKSARSAEHETQRGVIVAGMRPLDFSLFGLVALALHCGGSDPAPAPQAPAGSPAAVGPAESGPAATPPSCPDGTAFSQEAGKVVVDVVVGGKTVRAVLDTGASASLFSSALALKGGTDVTVAGRTVHLDRTYVDDDALATLRMPEIDAVIGADVTARYTLTLDYPRGRVMLDEALDEKNLAACTHVAPAQGWTEFQGNRLAYVRGAFEGHEGWLLLDTGASLGLVTESAFAALDGKRKRPAVPGFYTPAAIGTFWAKLTRIESIEVAGVRVENVVARTVPDEALDGAPKKGGDLLGIVPSDFFSQLMISFDYPKKRVRIAPATDMTPRLPTRYFPVGVGLEESLDEPVRIRSVLEGSAAAEAGIAVGDELVSVGGKKVVNVDPYARPWMLLGPRAGLDVSVVVRHGASEQTFSLVTRDLL